MGEVAIVAELAHFVGLVVPAPVGLILLVNSVLFLLADWLHLLGELELHGVTSLHAHWHLHGLILLLMHIHSWNLLLHVILLIHP